MKKSFLDPEAQIIVLQVKDIVTASGENEGEDIFDGGIGDDDDDFVIRDEGV